MVTKRLYLIIIILLLPYALTLNAQLLNGDFEEGSCGFPFYWSAEAWQFNEADFLWEEGSGIDGSRCICLHHTTPNDSRFIQTLELKPFTSYMLEGWVKGENIKNQQGGTVFANISIMEEWNYRNSPSGTFDWMKLNFCFTTDSSGKAKIGLRLGYFGNVVTGRAWFDNFTLSETDTLCGLEVHEGLHLKTLLKAEDLEVISDNNMYRWLGHLDSCYEKYYELVGFTPYGGEIIEILSVDDYPGGWAVAGNPIKWYQPWIKQELRTINDQDNWSFGIMHEISHDFDHSSWNFYGEHFANFKLYYAAEKLKSTIVLGGNIYEKGEIKEIFRNDYHDRLDSYYKDGSVTKFRDGLTYRYICLKDSIGWEPFKNAFRFCKDEDFSGRPLEKYIHFLDLLSRFSETDARKYIPKLDRDLFVKSIGGVSLPFSPDSLEVTERGCHHIQLAWKNVETDIRAVEIERRTSHTWYKPLDFINYDIKQCPEYEYWKDYHNIHEDSSYYYRIKAYVSTGPSAYSLETFSKPILNSETPAISPASINLCQEEDLNMYYVPDSLSGGMKTFFIRDDTAMTDTLIQTLSEPGYNKQLWLELYIENEMDSTDTYLKLFADSRKGYWSFRLDSVTSSDYPCDSVYDFHYFNDDSLSHSWLMSIMNTASFEKKKNRISFKPDQHFEGKIMMVYQSLNTCSYTPLSDTFIIEVRERWTYPGPIQGKTVYCQEEEQKFYIEELSEGRHTGWGFTPIPLISCEIRNDTLYLVPESDYSGNFRVMSYTDGNCGVDLYYDTLEVEVIRNPDLSTGTADSINLCYGDSVHLNYETETGLNVNWILPGGEKIVSRDTILSPAEEILSVKYFLSDVSGCHSDTASRLFNLIKVKADFYAEKIMIVRNDTVHLINMSENADSFMWYTGDGSISTEFEPECCFKYPGLYDLALKAVDSESQCSDSLLKEEYISVTESNAAVAENPPGYLEFFPNPVKDELLLSIQGQDIIIESLELYSIKGKKLKIIKPEISGVTRISMQEFAPGIYFLRIKMNRGICNHVVIKR